MSNIEKIRQEIERRIKLYSITNEEEQWIVNTYWSVLSFIDSLPEEKPSEDLEEAAEKYADKHGFRVPYDGSNNYYDDVDVKASKEGFIAGAEWHEQQMMEEAVVSEIGITSGGILLRDLRIEDFDYEDRAKIIIVKQDDRPRD